MSRKLICEWFDSPQGQILLHNEVCFLKQTINLGCQQTILQLGSLGWEDQFIDCSLYQRFIVIDQPQFSCRECAKINSRIDALPVASDSVDMVILPHLLEFEENFYQILRESERVLQPEGQLIILGFNPWSVFTMYQKVRGSSNNFCCRGRFISRFRMIDRLHLLNFEAEVVAGFNLNTVYTRNFEYKQIKKSLSVTAYGIRAIKRRFHLIPLQSSWLKPPRLSTVGTGELTRN